MEKHYCLLAVVQSFKAYIVLLDCEIPPSKCLKDGKKKPYILITETCSHIKLSSYLLKQNLSRK